ncbi:MAG: ComEC/Rec2 family competence protein [Flavobacterium sp.]
MPILRYPIVSLTLFFAIGICLGRYVHLSDTFLVIAGVFAFFTTAVTYFLSRRITALSYYFTAGAWLLLMVMVCGAAVYKLQYAPSHRLHYFHLVGDGTPTITGHVSERLKPNEFAEKYYFEVNAVDGKAATGKILLTLPKDSTFNKFQEGQRLLIYAEPQLVPKALNPYQFDYGEYLRNQNVFHRITLKKNFVKTGFEKNADFYLGKLRQNMSRSFDVHDYDSSVKEMLNALLLGQRQDLEKSINENYINTGVVHILAISGLHFGVLYIILGVLLRPLDRFGSNGRLLRLILILGILWLFALISGMSASVVRSVVTFTFIGIGLYINRNSNIYNSLAASMFFILLFTPNFLFDVGFQLSYGAVIAIVALQPVYMRLPKSKCKAANYLTETIWLSLAAQLGVLPLCLYYFNQFPLLFLLANIVVVPLSTGVLLLGLLVLVLNYVWEPAAVFLGYILELLINIMNYFTAWVASFKDFTLQDIPFTLMLAVVLYAVVFATGRWLLRIDFQRTAALLGSIIAFQCLYIFTKRSADDQTEMVIFNEWNGSLIVENNNRDITVYNNDTTIFDNRNLKAYARSNFSDSLILKPLQNVFWYRAHKVLLIDSTAVYRPGLKLDVLVLTQSPKINLEKVITELKPRQIVADASNYKYMVNYWKSTCRKQKIPFHATAEKGFYKID